MIFNTSLDEYILAHIDPEPDQLARLHRETHLKLLHPRMISGHLQGRLLKMFVQMINPENVLELGTFSGYSALCIAEGLLKKNAQVHTIEINDELEDFIRRALNNSPYKERIRLHIGDATKIIPNFEDQFFDLAFVDADKRLYWEHYELILPKLRKGGFVLADNTLWSGKVVEETVNNDYQTKGILAFNEKLASDTRVEKVILPIRDGLTLIRKK
jgi:predicted O-methyltransferase YrrM